MIARKYIFSFNIYNSAVAQEAPPIFIELSGIVAVTTVLMHTDEGNRAPMLIGGFTTRAVGQSTPSLSSENTITVTLRNTPYALHPAPYTLSPGPYTLHRTPHTLHLKP